MQVDPYQIVKIGDFEVSNCATPSELHITLPNGKSYSVMATENGMMITSDDKPDIRAFQSPSDLTTIIVE